MIPEPAISGRASAADAGATFPRRAARRALWLSVAAIWLIPVPAFFVFPPPATVMMALAAVMFMAVWRRTEPLLILAALGPMAGAIHALTGAPFGADALLEVFVLVVLGGASIRAAFGAAPLRPSAFDLAAVAFASVAVASCIAQLPVTLLRAGANDWIAALSELAFREYFLRPASFVVVERTAVLLEGTALAVFVAHAIRTPGNPQRLANMIVAGGTAAAALNFYRLLEVSLRRPPFLESFGQFLQSLRFNTQYGELNAAGSYFAMVTILATYRSGFRTTAGRLHAAAVPLLVFGLWVSGSRVALAAAALCSIGAIAAREYGHVVRRLRSRSATIIAGVALLLAFGALVFLLSLTRHATFQYSVSTRFELLKIGARMAWDRPIFGVGTTQYYAQFPKYAVPELEAAFADALGRPVPRENAHNQFVQVLAELGIVGLIPFVTLLALALRRSEPLPRWRAAVLVALTGFLLTSLAGHPLLTPHVAWMFWIAVGLGAAASPPAAGLSRRTFVAAAVFAVAGLVVTMPWRWALERREADLAGVSLGLSSWQRDADGTRFRMAAGPAALFVSSQAPLVKVPLRSATQRLRVRILLDGRHADTVVVTPERWTDAALPLPAWRGTPLFRRIDLVAEPAGDAPPAEEPGLRLGRVEEVWR